MLKSLTVNVIRLSIGTLKEQSMTKILCIISPEQVNKGSVKGAGPASQIRLLFIHIP